MKGEPCSECGKENRRGGSTCSACYQRRYRDDPERRRKHRDAVRRYTARNPEKRARWVRTYRERIGYYVPDLTALRAAIKAVDRAAQRASVRRAGEQGGDDDPERRDR